MIKYHIFRISFLDYQTGQGEKYIFIYTQVYLHTFYLKIQYTHVSLGNYISGRIKPFFNSGFILHDEFAALYETAVPFYELEQVTKIVIFGESSPWNWQPYKERNKGNTITIDIAIQAPLQYIQYHLLLFVLVMKHIILYTITGQCALLLLLA